MRNLVIRPNRVAREIDSFFNDFLSYPKVWANGEADFVPRVDIIENDEHVKMHFEVPGLNKDDIKVGIKDKVLSVSGERKVETEEKNESYVRSEIRTGAFCRSFTLPDTIDPDKIKADYKNGILELTLNKREEVKPKEIEIKVS